MSTLAEIRTKVLAVVKDDSGKLELLADATRLSAGVVVNPDDYDRAIAESIGRYSRHRPAEAVEDIPGNGTHDVDLPGGWIDEFSTVRSVEYPVGHVPASLVENDACGIYQTPAGSRLRLVAVTPGASEAVRLTYTVMRTDSTVPAGDVDAVCNLAASLCLEWLANIFTQTGDSTIAADAVNYRSKGTEFASRARRLMQLYKEHMGLKDDDTTRPAAAIADSAQKYPGGSERLTHPEWARRRR